MDQEQQHNSTGTKNNIEDILNSQHVTQVIETANNYLKQKESLDIEKIKKIHIHSLINRVGYFIFLFLIIGVLTYLVAIKIITETVFATLISAVIGYTIGNTQNKSSSNSK